MRNYMVECDYCGEKTTAHYCSLALPCGCQFHFCRPEHRAIFEFCTMTWDDFHEHVERDPVTGRILRWFGDEVDDA